MQRLQASPDGLQGKQAHQRVPPNT
jgi:hypothetical protein